MNCNSIYRITVILKVETNFIANISASPIVRARIYVMMSVEAFRTDVIVFISDVIMCFTSDWPINLCTRVKNWPNIFVNQSQFSDSDFINGIHQRENVQFTDKETFFVMVPSYYICSVIMYHTFENIIVNLTIIGVESIKNKYMNIFIYC